MRITSHAKSRIKKRWNVKAKDIPQFLDRVKIDGKYWYEFKGTLRRYLDSIRLKNGDQITKIILYANNIFIIRNKILITMFPIRGGMVKLVKDQMGEK